MRYFCAFICLIFTSSLSLAQEKPWFPESPKNSGNKRIIGSNDLEDIEEAIGTDFYEMARSVARVEMSGNGYCTGFRVGEDMMMTNNHCYKGCSKMFFRFAYERGLTEEDQAYLKCTELVTRNSNLDFSLMKVEQIRGVSMDNFPVVTLSRRELQEDELLFIAGHPRARKKEMDRSDNCQITDLPSSKGTSVEHTCDTEGGNSGSSVFHRDSGHVIAIHWGYSGYNRATWMDYILDYIEENAPEAYEQLTIAE